MSIKSSREQTKFQAIAAKFIICIVQLEITDTLEILLGWIRECIVKLCFFVHGSVDKHMIDIRINAKLTRINDTQISVRKL